MALNSELTITSSLLAMYSLTTLRKRALNDQHLSSEKGDRAVFSTSATFDDGEKNEEFFSENSGTEKVKKAKVTVTVENGDGDDEIKKAKDTAEDGAEEIKKAKVTDGDGDGDEEIKKAKVTDGDGDGEKRDSSESLASNASNARDGTVLYRGKMVPATCDFRKTFLDTLHPHPRDEHILFDEGPHKYYIHGEMWPTSTTSWIGQYHVEFDGDKIAPIMVRSEKFAKCQGEHKKYSAIVKRWRDEKLHVDDVVRLVKEWWKQNGEEASSLGTRMHKQIEDYVNEVASSATPDANHPDRLTPEFSQFLSYWADMVGDGFVPYRTEMKVYGEKYMLCGTVDMIFIDGQGRYRLRDWKRSKKISMFSRDYCTPPFQRFRSCNFIKYSMQLHFYAKILREYYGIPIYDMAMVIFHPNQKTYSEIFALDLSAEMDAALQQHASSLALH